MEALLEKRNDALRVNPDIFRYPTRSDINITTNGSSWYWAVTAIMTASTFAFVGLSLMVPRRNRVFHYITASVTMVAAIAYFTMASNLGYTPILVEFQRSNPRVRGQYREIFYVRYIDWFITTPLLLLDLLLTAGLPWPTILYTLLLDEIMIVTGLVGALVASSYKWGYFVFAMIALFFIAWNVVQLGRLQATALGAQVRKTYLLCGVWTMFLWFLYPIAWGVSEGGNVISPDSEAVFYGILDILAKPVFGALLLWGHRDIDPALLGLQIRDYDDAIAHNEKHAPGISSSAAHAANSSPATASGPAHTASPATQTHAPSTGTTTGVDRPLGANSTATPTSAAATTATNGTHPITSAV